MGVASGGVVTQQIYLLYVAMVVAGQGTTGSHTSVGAYHPPAKHVALHPGLRLTSSSKTVVACMVLAKTAQQEGPGLVRAASGLRTMNPTSTHMRRVSQRTVLHTSPAHQDTAFSADIETEKDLFGRHVARVLGPGRFHDLIHASGQKVTAKAGGVRVLMVWASPVPLGGMRAVCVRAFGARQIAKVCKLLSAYL